MPPQLVSAYDTMGDPFVYEKYKNRPLLTNSMLDMYDPTSDSIQSVPGNTPPSLLRMQGHYNPSKNRMEMYEEDDLAWYDKWLQAPGGFGDFTDAYEGFVGGLVRSVGGMVETMFRASGDAINEDQKVKWSDIGRDIAEGEVMSVFDVFTQKLPIVGGNPLPQPIMDAIAGTGLGDAMINVANAVNQKTMDISKALRVDIEAEERTFVHNFFEGGTSLAAGLGLMIVAKKPRLAAAMVTGMGVSDVYNEARELGSDEITARRSLMGQATTTYFLERIGLQAIFGGMGMNTLGKRIAAGAMAEGATEFQQTYASMLIENGLDIKDLSADEMFTNAMSAALYGSLLGGTASGVLGKGTSTVEKLEDPEYMGAVMRVFEEAFTEAAGEAIVLDERLQEGQRVIGALGLESEQSAMAMQLLKAGLHDYYNGTNTLPAIARQAQDKGFTLPQQEAADMGYSEYLKEAFNKSVPILQKGMGRNARRYITELEKQIEEIESKIDARAHEILDKEPDINENEAEVPSAAIGSAFRILEEQMGQAELDADPVLKGLMNRRATVMNKVDQSIEKIKEDADKLGEEGFWKDEQNLRQYGVFKIGTITKSVKDGYKAGWRARGAKIRDDKARQVEANRQYQRAIAQVEKDLGEQGFDRKIITKIREKLNKEKVTPENLEAKLDKMVTNVLDVTSKEFRRSITAGLSAAFSRPKSRLKEFVKNFGSDNIINKVTNSMKTATRTHKEVKQLVTIVREVRNELTKSNREAAREKKRTGKGIVYNEKILNQRIDEAINERIDAKFGVKTIGDLAWRWLDAANSSADPEFNAYIIPKLYETYVVPALEGKPLDNNSGLELIETIDQYITSGALSFYQASLARGEQVVDAKRKIRKANKNKGIKPYSPGETDEMRNAKLGKKLKALVKDTASYVLLTYNTILDQAGLYESAMNLDGQDRKKRQLIREATELVETMLQDKLGNKLTKYITISSDENTMTITNAAGVEIKMTKGQAITRYMQLRNDLTHSTITREDGHTNMRYTDENIEQIEEFIGPEGKEIATILFEGYESMYEPINEVFKRMHGIDLPRQRSYSPALTVKEEIDQEFDELNLDGKHEYFDFFTSSHLKDKTGTTRELQMPDAFDMFYRYVHNTSHWVSFAEQYGIIQEIFADPETMSELKGAIGEAGIERLRKTIDTLRVPKNGNADQSLKMIDYLRNVSVKSTLALNPQVGIKQVTSLLNVAADIGMGPLQQGMIDFFANPIKNYNKLAEHDTLVNRGRNFNNEMIDESTGRKTKLGKWLSGDFKAMDYFMLPVRIGDKIPIILGGHAMTKHYEAQGYAPDQAMDKAFDLLERSQQSRLVGNQTLGSLKGNSLYKLIAMYTSSPLAMVNMMMRARYRHANGEIGREEMLKTIGIYQVAVPVFFGLVSQALDPFDDDETESLLTNMTKYGLAGPWTAVPLFGNAVDLSATMLANGIDDAYLGDTTELRTFRGGLGEDTMLSAAWETTTAMATMAEDGVTSVEFFMALTDAIDLFMAMPVGNIRDVTSGSINGLEWASGKDIPMADDESPEESLLKFLGYSEYIRKQKGYD